MNSFEFESLQMKRELASLRSSKAKILGMISEIDRQILSYGATESLGKTYLTILLKSRDEIGKLHRACMSASRTKRKVNNFKRPIRNHDYAQQRFELRAFGRELSRLQNELDFRISSYHWLNPEEPLTSKLISELQDWKELITDEEGMGVDSYIIKPAGKESSNVGALKSNLSSAEIEAIMKQPIPKGTGSTMLVESGPKLENPYKPAQYISVIDGICFGLALFGAGLAKWVKSRNEQE